MKNVNVVENSGAWRPLLVACTLALGLASIAPAPAPVAADHVTVPPVPASIEVPDGPKAFLTGHAVGTQNYICLPSGSGFAWTLFGPQATLFKGNSTQLMTHFLSPNPVEGGTPRATWQHSKDTSAVWAAAIASSSDPDFVAPGAIPWLLLTVMGAQPGPTGGDQLGEVTFIQRLNTAGGLAPSTGCTQLAHVGTRALVPYTADYVFYKGEADDN
jgi:hypothetical protein